jgi:hypothetical protein
MFAVDDIDDTIARLRPHGAEPIGEVARYEDSYRLCYLRGPSGIVITLAEQIGWPVLRGRSASGRNGPPEDEENGR